MKGVLEKAGRITSTTLYQPVLVSNKGAYTKNHWLFTNTDESALGCLTFGESCFDILYCLLYAP